MDNFWQQVQKSLSKKAGFGIITPSPTECIFWKGGLNGRYGKVKVRWPDQSRSSLFAHRLSVMYFTRTLYLNPDLQVSHLCHHRLCVNPYHLVLESPVTNNERNKCKSLKNCNGLHTPPCLF